MMHETLGRLLADPADRAEMVQREELVRDVPAIRARAHESMSATGRLLGAVIAERTGRAPDDLHIRIFTAAVFGVLHETTQYWAESGRDADDLLLLLDETLSMLHHGLAL
ncbi:hypothetical protein RLT57_19360 [Streptomyces sp. ITFR-21]|nr:hypothetical protein [Streptomyces sp. ITFR-21]WNI17458.1 hypothetical protein RLT57_19360 [Streptomyces sp. ITFR-21]